MTVHDIQTRMPYDELLRWYSYFEARPVGWREDQRTHYILQSAGVTIPPSEIFPSLASMSKQATPNPGAALRRSAIFSLMQGAVGGDSPDFLKG